MILALALMAVQPAAAADELQVPVCALVAPGGEKVGFFIWSDGTPNEVRLSSTEGSAWPARTVAARRPSSSDGVQFIIGGHRGFILELGRAGQGSTRRSATLFRSAAERDTYPVAYGSCADAAPPREPSPILATADQIGTDLPAFDSARWPSDCAMVTERGDVVRFGYRIQDRWVSLSSPTLWGGNAVRVPVSWPSGDATRGGRFGESTGPSGAEVLMLGRGRGAKLIYFANLGDPATPAQTARGICGIRAVERRPNPQ